MPSGSGSVRLAWGKRRGTGDVKQAAEEAALCSHGLPLYVLCVDARQNSWTLDMENSRSLKGLLPPVSSGLESCARRCGRTASAPCWASVLTLSWAEGSQFSTFSPCLLGPEFTLVTQTPD